MSQFYNEWMMVSNKNVLVAVRLKEVDSSQRLRMMNRNMKLCLAVMKWRTIILADDDNQILFSASNISGQEKAIINFQGSFEIRISLAFQGAPFLEAEATSGRVKNELKSAAAMALQSNTELYESHFDRCHQSHCPAVHITFHPFQLSSLSEKGTA